MAAEYSDRIAVWSVRIDQVPLEGAYRALTQTELDRAAKFKDRAAQRSFVVMRAALHDILHFTYNTRADLKVTSYGKPILPGGPNVSWSHSGTFGVLVADQLSPVGIDIEPKDRLTSDPLGLAHVAFSKTEQRELRSFPCADQQVQFLRHWCRREALLKAAGVGIAVDSECLTLPMKEGPAHPTYFDPPVAEDQSDWHTAFRCGHDPELWQTLPLDAFPDANYEWQP